MKTSFCNILLLVLTHLCSTNNSAAQSHLYPLKSLYGPDKSPIELIGSEPEFIIWCLQSEFGAYETQKNASELESDEQPGPISVKWKNNVRNEWSKLPFNIELNATLNSHELDDGNATLVSHTRIAFIDKSGSDLLQPKKSSSGPIRKFLQALLFQSTSYVNSSNGVNVREHPSITAPVVDKLADNSKVIIKEKTNEWMELPKGDDTVRSEWVKVYVNEKISGYVISAFLSTFYEIRSSEIKMLNDSLHGYLELSQIDFEDYRDKKSLNNYSLDTTDITIRASLPKTGDAYEDSRFNAFYLPVRNGKDSILLYSQPGEYGDITKSYIGKIRSLNWYLVETGGFFSEGYSFFDMNSGKEIWGSSGMPHVSIGGKLIIDFYDHDEPEVNDDLPVCKIAVSERHGAEQFATKWFYLPFPFFVSPIGDDVFWISDNELIIRLYKITPYYAEFTDHRNTLTDWKSQYFKLKIAKSIADRE